MLTPFDKERVQTILIYDLGGGTFDVSILKVDSAEDELKEITILAKAGVEKLGGDDFDRKIMEIAAAKLKVASEIDILAEGEQPVNVNSLRAARQKLKIAAEEAKHILTDAQSASIQIPNIIKDERGELHTLNMEITRDEFNDAIRDLILQSKVAVEAAVAEAGVHLDEAAMAKTGAHLEVPFSVKAIDRIVLVGGSTRVPLVKELVAKMCEQEPYRADDPETVVARGAAIVGASLILPIPIPGREDSPSSIEIHDIVTHFPWSRNVRWQIRLPDRKRLGDPRRGPSQCQQGV